MEYMPRNVRFSEMSLDELLAEMHKMELTREDDFDVNAAGYDSEIRLYKQVLRELSNTEILRQYFINHPQSIDKYTFLRNSAFTHWVKEKCSKIC